VQIPRKDDTMMRKPTRKSTLVAATAALLVAGGTGAAIAAQGTSPSPSAFFDSLAKHLGISTEKLRDATKAAAVDQVDAALKAGTITEEQAKALKERINSGDAPLFLGPRFALGHRLGGPGFHHGFGFFGGQLSAAADYLGLTVAQLRDKLANGQSLADVAKAQGKSLDGLKQAIRDAAKKQLDKAVSDGLLTAAQEKDILDRLDQHLDEIVSNTFPRWHERPLPGAFFGPAFRGDPRGRGAFPII
jgi:hypothetical protein